MAVELIYCATPSRLKEKTEAILKFVNKTTPYAPLHPFVAFPYELFEGNQKIGKNNTMDYCIRAVDICSRFALFGISEGTATIELPHALKSNKPVDVFIEQFDPNWREYYLELKKNNPNLQANLEKAGVII